MADFQRGNIHVCAQKQSARGLSTGSVGMAPRPPNTRLQDAADAFMDEANRLREIIESIGQTLTPLLIPEMPASTAGVGNAPNSKSTSEHLYTLEYHKATVKASADRLADILSRLDI